MKLGLKGRTTLLATAVVVAMLLVVGVLQYDRLGRSYRELLLAQQDALAERVADGMADKLQTLLSVLVHSADAVDAAMLADPAARQDFLARLSPARGLFDRIGIVDPSGAFIANEPPLASGRSLNIADRDHFRRLMATGRPVISDPMRPRTGAPVAVAMLAPVHGADGRIVAAVSALLKLQSAPVFGTLAQAPVGRSGHFEVVTLGPSPVNVVHPDPARLHEAATPLSALSGDVVTRKPIRGVDWELRVVLPAGEAEAPLDEARRRLTEQMLASALAAALLVWFGTRWLLAPLGRLHGAIRELRATPGAAPRLDTGSDDEHGRLASEFEALMRELHRRQAELAAVTEASPLGFYRADCSGRVTYVNQAYLAIHGLQRDEAEHGWLTLVPAERRDEARRGWQAAAATPEAFNVIRRLTRRDGREIVVSVRSAPLHADGRFDGHVGTVSDVTERIEAEKALRMQAAIFDATPDYVVQTDAAGRISYMNPAARRAGGIGADEPVKHRSDAEFRTPQTNDLLADVVLPAVAGGGAWLGETTFLGAAGREVPVSHLVIAHRDRHGRIEHYSAVMRDISAEVEARRTLLRHSATLRSVAEAIPAHVSVVGSDGCYRFVNSAFERWCGAPRDRIVGRTMREVLGVAEYERSRPWMERALAGETVHFETTHAGRGGAAHLAISFVPLWLDGGGIDGFVAVAQDVTQHKQEEGRLLQMTQRDALTDLLNRLGFERYLEQRLADGAGAGLALLYIDLDHFKPVNDRHGHTVGDRLLQLFADRLRRLVRPTDAVARLGGDEFAVVLAGVREPAHAHAVALKIIDATRSPFEVGPLHLSVGASVGVAFGVDASGDWRDLVARADAMLYQAKNAGRGRLAAAVM